MSLSVRVECPACSRLVSAEPNEAGDGETLQGRSVPCGDCGHAIDFYYY